MITNRHSRRIATVRKFDHFLSVSKDNFIETTLLHVIEEVASPDNFKGKNYYLEPKMMMEYFLERRSNENYEEQADVGPQAQLAVPPLSGFVYFQVPASQLLW